MTDHPPIKRSWKVAYLGSTITLLGILATALVTS